MQLVKVKRHLIKRILPDFPLCVEDHPGKIAARTNSVIGKIGKKDILYTVLTQRPFSVHVPE